MRVILETTNEYGRAKKISLRDGQSAWIGNSELSDFCFADDPSMASRHFIVTCDSGGCELRVVQTTHETSINGQVVNEAVLNSGDRIRAGRTEFAVTVEGQPNTLKEPSRVADAQVKTTQAAAAVDVVRTPQSLPGTAAEVCESLEMGDEAREELTETLSPGAYLTALVGKQLFPDAARFCAHALPKREAVLWALLAVREQMPNPETKDAAALDATARWLREPNEDNRRAAESAAKATEFKTAAGWVALGAFWSGGSIAPAQLPDVEPDPTLTANAVVGSIMMAATRGAADTVAEAYRTVFAIAAQIIEGNDLFELTCTSSNSDSTA